ncbi:hypothetical protein E0Z10_g9406 [Xylaria hypoxylon]|uniref:FAD dependent oxidoreductase domain-containing protein n=1 Tax=Xylaria hypoxylon TaxID=37992 RepID=A0A4Z0Y5P3_9PEZI|nr:hypothetical protein E0Z10_g9406 [Xylaria hypoxylon]
MGGGFVNTDLKTGVPHPSPGTLERSHFMPAGDERQLRKLLAHLLLSLVNRPFTNKTLSNKTLCWFADTAHSDYIPDYMPGASNSVILLSGGSGHGFEVFPVVRSWVELYWMHEKIRNKQGE